MSEPNFENIVEFLDFIKIVYGTDYSVSNKSTSLLPEVYVEDHHSEHLEVKDSAENAKSGSGSSDIIKQPLLQYYEEIKNCQNCQLGNSRKNFVFGSGSSDADLMIIGEAPGAEEDAIGQPFVGKAGQLLTKILEAIGLSRNEVYIANILKCRPPNNRDPLPDEIAQCRPYLNRQIEMINPRVILLLGRIAAQTFFESKDSLKLMRGRIRQYQNIDVFVTYHPAALLRNPHWKRPTWEDMKKVKARLKSLENGK